MEAAGEDTVRTTNGNIFAVDITLEQAREACDFPGFRECAKEDYIVFNYDFSFRESFPNPRDEPDPHKSLILNIRRECRGLIFDKATGKVIARRLHKFFNIGELPETQPELIDISRPHIVLEKMDGCLVGPFYTEGKLRFGSKMGTTEVSNRMESEWMPTCGIDYHGFAEHWVNKGFSLMFEWCSAQQQIVVGYPEDALWLLSMRSNSTGEYVLYDDMVRIANKAGIPVVQARKGEMDSVVAVLDMVKAAQGCEGFVLVFQDNGEMYKMKSEWYFERSKKIAGSTLGSQEKDIWKLILSNQLDDIAIAIGPQRRERIEKFATDLFCAIDRTAKRVQETVDEAIKRDVGKREFVEEISSRLAAGDPTLVKDKSLYFVTYAGADPSAVIIETLKKASSNRTKLNQVRHLAEDLKFIV